MTHHYKLRIIVILSVVVIALLFYIGKIHNETKSYRDELHKRYVSDTVRITKRLNESLESRNRAYDSIAYYDRTLKNVRDSLRISEGKLKQIPGKFNKLTNVELQNKMIEEFNKRND